MRKYLWIAVIALIASAVYFTSCERIPKMMDPLLPDAEQIEPTEMPPEIMEEMMEEMMEMPVDSVDVLVYIGSTWWIEQMDAATQAGTLKSLLESEGIQARITADENIVRDWMLATTGNSAVNVLILYGVLPNTIYAAGNTQPDGSIAENWLETSDGDTILNHADYIGYQSTPDPENRRGHLAGESNRHGGLQNLMDIPNIVIPFSNGVTMIPTEDGMALTPSLGDFTSTRFMPLNQLQGEWFAEKVFASDTGDDQAAYADPVIVRDGDRGRIAIVHATSEVSVLPNAEVAAEIIINYLLAPPMTMEAVEPPVEPTVEMEMEMPEMMDFVEGVLHSDEFDSIDLQPFWNVQNDDKNSYMLSDGNIVVDGMLSSNIFEEDTSTAFYQVTTQDQFTVETSMVVDYEDACVVAGIFISSPTDQSIEASNREWVLLKLWGVDIPPPFPDAPDQSAILQFQNRGREIVRMHPGYTPPQGPTPIAMRIQRDGDLYIASFKPDAEGEWITVGETMLSLPEPLRVGVYTGICETEATAGNVTVSFDYFRVTTPE